MKHRTKSMPLEQEQQRTTEQRSQGKSVQEFATVEELLRYDAARTPVPPLIATRLRNSTGPTAATARSWWRRLLGL